ncbi:MAG: thioesterase [Lysobacteraceae bacterium]|nr:MAG: thioesterase [Xanthomonadaceae bacterium]
MNAVSSPLDERFPIVLFQDVHWGDMDAFNHVNNTVYFRYFEDARIAFFDRTGINTYMKENKIGPILAATNCDFRLPVSYPDRIHIGVSCSIIGPKKMNMQYAVYSEQFSKVAADGEGLVVYYDYCAGNSCEIPDSIVQAIKNLCEHR